jgi:hypothetical protein
MKKSHWHKKVNGFFGLQERKRLRTFYQNSRFSLRNLLFVGMEWEGGVRVESGGGGVGGQLQSILI